MKSTIRNLYVKFDASFSSGFIEQLRSFCGFTDRSSANNGDPLNPFGRFSVAVIVSPMPARPCDENEHCMLLTIQAIAYTLYEIESLFNTRTHIVFGRKQISLNQKQNIKISNLKHTHRHNLERDCVR